MTIQPMIEETNDILKRNDLSVTEGRRKVLELFLKEKSALNHGAIERLLGEDMDRVTIYRTLQVFVDKGIVHTIPTNDNSIRYALCRDHCEAGHHHDDHVHFVCDRCGNTLCVDEVTVPAVKLPKGFSVSRIEMVVSGTCADCATRS